ncbi:hypothetical protein SAMN04488518_10186 [Pseudovibrio ascidiaceicola]|uniref:Uncharacterized protein n=1 Tax=Pseudovibrio ascidiaceicola TaxID=285279 RepID=A0A1I3UY64_9HYPH|nr:hypothetical protein SAMN04488518_10186 [Pseudovibrio ascidiaceicola]
MCFKVCERKKQVGSQTPAPSAVALNTHNSTISVSFLTLKSCQKVGTLIFLKDFFRDKTIFSESCV